MKITKTTVEKLELPKKGQQLIWDSDLKGFGVRLTPTGRAYIAQARVNGKTRRVSLGKHGVITADKARWKARQELAKMSNGKDPVFEKEKEKALSVTLREVVTSYIQHRDLRPNSILSIEHHLKNNFAILADRPVYEITRDKVSELYRKKAKHSPSQANQAFRVLRALLNYARASYRAEGNALLPENPVDVLSDAKLWMEVKPRKNRIEMDKIGAFWNKLQGLRDDPRSSTRTAVDYVSFLLLTGTRRTEATLLTWDRVNLEDGFFHIPTPKNKNPVTLPLSSVAVEILNRRPRTNEFVFPGRTGTGALNNARKLLLKLATLTGESVSPHDIRRTFRAIAGDCGIELWKTKLLMNHSLRSDVTIHHYTETSDLKYLANEAEAIAGWIIEQAGKETEEKKAKKKTDNIVDLATRRAAG